MISIPNVNQRQVAVLDRLWQFETLEDLNDWVGTLPVKEQQEARTLQELIFLAVLDSLVT